MPPIRSGSTERVASTVRPEPSRSARRSRAPRRRRARRRWSARRRAAPPRARRAARTPRRPPRSRPPRPFSISSRRRLRTSGSASPATASTAASLRPPVELRVAQDLRELRHLRWRLDEVAELLSRTSASVPPSFAASKSDRAYVRCDDRHHAPSSSSALQHGEVEVADRVLDQLPVVVAVEHLAGHLRGGDERQLGDLGADLLERALRLGVDLLLRLLEAPLPVGLGLLADALALGIATACGPRRGSPPRRPWPCRSACGAPRAALRASSRARSASSSDSRIRSRRSSIAFWIGPNAYRLRTNNAIRKQTIVQIISPGVTLISALAATSSMTGLRL